MSDLPSLLIGLALANHFILAPLLTARTPDESAALPTGLATALALLPAAAVNQFVVTGLLAAAPLRPLGLLTALLAAFAFTPAAVRLTARLPPGGGAAEAPSLALVGVNSALISAALWATGRLASIGSALFWAAAAAVGFLVIMVLFAGLRERLEAAEVPAALRGPAIALVTAGFLSLALGGIGSVVRG